MTEDRARRNTIKATLDIARKQVFSYTGLYPDEDLSRDIRHACHRAAAGVAFDGRLVDALRLIDEHCVHLMQIADRFASRDLAGIVAARMQAVAAIDTFQDVVVDIHRTAEANQGPGPLLKRRAR